MPKAKRRARRQRAPRLSCLPRNTLDFASYSLVVLEGLIPPTFDEGVPITFTTQVVNTGSSITPVPNSNFSLFTLKGPGIYEISIGVSTTDDIPQPAGNKVQLKVTPNLGGLSTTYAFPSTPVFADFITYRKILLVPTSVTISVSTESALADVTTEPYGNGLAAYLNIFRLQ